ncbi:hypothetical protein PROFUN_01620 [Planoprotostelium fungivorum]|uniref:Cell division control protein 45 n=1 Tax=Planoprotostelium fungivorum TaxID=1890364 RepID=A0A2P6NU21_9EUKA|nr:hypothetical protein PROFUN_01620 [Planoprotostelium fungivorum]
MYISISQLEGEITRTKDSEHLMATGAFKLIKSESYKFKRDLNDPNAEGKVLIFVSHDADSLCAAQILSSLLQNEFISYIIRPVSSFEELVRCCRDDIDNETFSVFLINCAGSIPVLQYLSIPLHVTVYICDSHLPLHQQNLDDQQQVLVLPTDLYSGEDEDDKENEESNSRRSDVGSYYGISASRMMYEMSVQTKKANLEHLWLAIVGFTSQHVHHRMDDDIYERELNYFRQANSEFARDSQYERESRFDDTILYGKDFKFPLYRHWTLYDSMYHSTYVASRLGVWTESGKKNLKTILVRLGVPLDECMNKWSVMNTQNKAIVTEGMQEVASSYGLENLTVKSFYKNLGYRLQVSASDVAMAVEALLSSGLEPSKNFWKAFDALRSSDANSSVLEAGIESAIQVQQAIIRQGTLVIEKQVLNHSGPFRYAFINSAMDCNLFISPSPLVRLGEYIKEIVTEYGKNKQKKLQKKPLALLCFDPENDSWVVAGLPPTPASSSKKNKFGYALEHAASKTMSRISSHSFDPALLSILKGDIKMFMDYLHTPARNE